MNVFFRAIRWVLGQIILFFDWITRPRPIRRAPEEQEKVDRETAKLKLYHFQLCPFCVKTRRTMHKLALKIETRDARNDPKWNQELIEQGGKYQVPCLRIENEDGSVEWLYESDDINAYLERRFG